MRWQRNGADISGGTNSSYVIGTATLSDNGAIFRAFITNQVGTTNTAEAQLTVLRDTNAPTVAGVLAANATNVFVTFSERVAAASAMNLANYSLPGVTLLGADLAADERTVILRTSPLTFGNSYTLSASGVLDRASAPNALAPTLVPFDASAFNAERVGGGSQTGAVFPAGNDGATMTGGGAIGGNKDQFQFAWQSIAGDFDDVVRASHEPHVSVGIFVADVARRVTIGNRVPIGLVPVRVFIDGPHHGGPGLLDDREAALVCRQRIALPVDDVGFNPEEGSCGGTGLQRHARQRRN